MTALMSIDKLIEDVAAVSIATAQSEIARLTASLGADPDTIPGLSISQRDVLAEERAMRSRTIGTLQASVTGLDKPVGKIVEQRRRRALVVAATATVQKQLDDAPDWRSIGGMLGNRAWQEAEARKGIVAALTTRGVEYFGGRPAIADFVLDLLGGSWLGSLATIDREIAELEATIATLLSDLDRYVASAQTI